MYNVYNEIETEESFEIQMVRESITHLQNAQICLLRARSKVKAIHSADKADAGITEAIRMARFILEKEINEEK